jgi:hypothetical protein
MKKTLQAVAALLFITVLTYGQTNVAPGDGTLGAAIKAAASGAVLVLQSGGVYTESVDTFFVLGGKEIKIKAADGYTVRPVIKNLTVKTGTLGRANGFLLGANDGLELNGIEIDGLEPDTTTYRSMSNAITFIAGENYTIKYIKLYNCFFKNFESRVIDGAGDEYTNKNVKVESLLMENSLFTNADNVFNFKDFLFGNVEAKNCTFWNVRSGRVFRIMVPVDPTVLIDHCTFDNIGVSDRCIDTKDNKAAWTIKNCSFSNSKGTPSGEIVRIYNSQTVIKNCNFFNTGTANIKLQNGAVSQNITTDNPKYKDAANGDFTLAADSPLLGKADDGKAIGDLRWDPAATSISPESNQIPTGFTLYQNYPNPFNPTTKIRFDIPGSGFASLKVFNLLGQEVAELVSEELVAGSYSVDFDASNLTSGIYLYQLKSNGFTKTFKMMLMK